MIVAVIGFAIGCVLHSALRRWVGWFRADLIWVMLGLCGVAVSVIVGAWSAAAVWVGVVGATLALMRHTVTCEKCSS